MSNLCPQCGAPLPENAKKCEYCGFVITQQPQQQTVVQTEVQPQGQENQTVTNNQVPVKYKSKVAAGVLGILLGGLGIHKFYLGNIGLGIVYLLFCWTYIPAIIGFIEGIVILATKDENFERKYHCKIQK